jgi:hypothetical protein
MLWYVLIQFVLRLAFGLAAAMWVTSPKWVTSGFYRVHLWVVLGLNTFVGAVLVMLPLEFPRRNLILGLTIGAGVFAYVGSVLWLYESKRAGQIVLGVVTLTNLAGAVVADAVMVDGAQSYQVPFWATSIDTLTSGLLLGTTFSAMLLGHWYLNTPSMKLAPLQKLILLMVVSVGLRALVSGAGLVASWTPEQLPSRTFLWFVALRWISGLFGVVVLAWMSAQTLKIPNTQSATGILYVAVIFVFLGELTSQLLSAQSPFPL